MVTQEEINNRVFTQEMQMTPRKGCAQVTMSEMQQFDE